MYGPMLGTWSQMWRWMWQMQLVWMPPLLITVTVIVTAIVVRSRRPGTRSARAPAHGQEARGS